MSTIDKLDSLYNEGVLTELINKGFIVKEGTTPNTTYQFISKEVGSMDEKYCKVNYIK